MPCSKCKVTLHHLQNHGGVEHCRENCTEDVQPKDYQFFKDSLLEVTRHTNLKQRCDDLLEEDNLSDNNVQTLEDIRKEAKSFGNVISILLLEFDDINDMVDPLMHVLMGLTNDNLNQLKKDCKNLDALNESGKKDRDILISRLYERMVEKQKLLNRSNECTRELKDMREILPLIVDKKYDEAEKISTKNHKSKLSRANKKKPRQVCSSKYCLLFNIDVQQGYDRKIECVNGCQPHTLCEALSDFSSEVTTEEMQYSCTNCDEMTAEEIDERFSREISNLEEKSHAMFVQCNDLSMNIDSLKSDNEKSLGKKEMEYYGGLKAMKTEECSYHGGDLNGKDCNKILLDAQSALTISDSVTLACIAEELPEKAKGYFELFKILANVWQTLRQPPAGGLFDDEDLDEIIGFCESWSKRLPILFPERNITRKGHVLSFHIPEYLRKYRTYYQYYKLEQAGESIHAKFNKLMTRFASMKPKEKRLWKMIEEYERSNLINKDNLKARKKKPKLPLAAKLTGSTLGIVAVILILLPLGL
jgi:hypothetical protein